VERRHLARGASSFSEPVAAFSTAIDSTGASICSGTLPIVTTRSGAWNVRPARQRQLVGVLEFPRAERAERPARANRPRRARLEPADQFDRVTGSPLGAPMRTTRRLASAGIEG